MARNTLHRFAPKAQRESGTYTGQFHGEASTHQYRNRFDAPLTTDQLASGPPTSDNPAQLTRKERRALKSKRGVQ
jgi:hypothetical protein